MTKLADDMVKHIEDFEILGPEDEAEKEKTVRRNFWSTARKAMRSVPFMTDVVAAYYAMLDPLTPKRTRLLILAALAYFVSPIDVVPDFIFGFGFVDDASVLAAALAAITSSIRVEHREAAKRAMSEKGLDDSPPDAKGSAHAGA